MSSDEVIIRIVQLGVQHTDTGKTSHFRHGKRLGLPTILKIVQYKGESGFLLVRYDESRAEMTDTFHESIELALEQAEWEYGVKPTEWIIPTLPAPSHLSNDNLSKNL